MIVGSRGQDGLLLSDLLRGKKYEVLGIAKPDSTARGSTGSVDIFSADAVHTFVKKFQPHEIYYLVAHHHSAQESMAESLNLESLSQLTHVDGLRHFLEAMLHSCPQSRLFYAASSLIFGNTKELLQNENTPFKPDTIYGKTKLSGLLLCRKYRTEHGIFASSGILYNHESPLRSEKFVSQKIIEAAVNIKKGVGRELVVGDLDVLTDWSYAGDFVEAMVKILAAPAPDDFIVASGVGRSVREFIEVTFGLLGLKWQDFVKVDPGLVQRKKAILVGDAQKLKVATGWVPKTTFTDMIRIMIAAKGIVLE